MIDVTYIDHLFTDVTTNKIDTLRSEAVSQNTDRKTTANRSTARWLYHCPWIHRIHRQHQCNKCTDGI